MKTCRTCNPTEPADPYLEDAIAHLEWRGMAKAVREDGRVTVIFEEQR